MWGLLLAGLLACGEGPTEICDNGIDDDGNGRIDCDQRRCRRTCDVDGDGHRALARGGRDCDDTDPAVFPDAPEVCNGIDDDCDGLADDADVQGGPVDPVGMWLDRDGDGWGDADFPLLRCAVGPSVAEVVGDCDDGHADTNPDRPEVCDGRDNDCDGRVDRPDDEDGDGDAVCSDCDDADPARSSLHQERCSGVDDDCDGLVDEADDSVDLYSCGYCPEADASIPLQVVPWFHETLNPCVLDPTSVAECSTDPKSPDTHTDGRLLHRIVWRTDQGWWRDRLLVFLAPGPGRFNETLRHWGAYAGYRVIGLGYPNEATVSDECNSLEADTCWPEVRDETLYGTDLSPHVDVGPQDSIEARLSTVLAHLAVEHPDMGFERHVDADGQVLWEDIVVMGWSFGGGMAGFVAKTEPVAGVIMMSSPKDHVVPGDETTVWTSWPSVTPGCAMYATWHVEEPFTQPPSDVLAQAYDAMGLPQTEHDIDLQPGWPAAGTHRISQSLPVAQMRPGCDGHSSVGHDDCMRDEQLDAYLYMLCSAAEVDAATCD